LLWNPRGKKFTHGSGEVTAEQSAGQEKEDVLARISEIKLQHMQKRSKKPLAGISMREGVAVPNVEQEGKMAEAEEKLRELIRTSAHGLTRYLRKTLWQPTFLGSGSGRTFPVKDGA